MGWDQVLFGNSLLDPPESGVWYHGGMKGKDRRVISTSPPPLTTATDSGSAPTASSSAVAEMPAVGEIEPKSPSDALRGTGGDGDGSGGRRRKSAPPLAPVTLELTRALEAILISTDRPVSLVRLSEALAGCESASGSPEASPSVQDAPAMSVAEPIPTGRVKAAIEALNQQYEDTGRVFRVQPIAGGFRLMTVPSVARVLENFHGARQRASLSRAAIETLAILAYRQPLTRAKLEAIRGVACGEILRSLTERRLVTVVGRAEELGRPLLYGTTKQFLEAFGLSSIKDLPTVEEFKARTAGGDEDDD